MRGFRYGRHKSLYVGIDFADRHDYTALVVLEDPVCYSSVTMWPAYVKGELKGDASQPGSWHSPLELSADALYALMDMNNKYGWPPEAGWPTMAVREIKRYRGIGLPEVVQQIKKFLGTRPFRHKELVTGVATDRTGVGLGPTQDLWEEGVDVGAAIFIHGGNTHKVDPHDHRLHNVPQGDLIYGAQAAAERGELHFNPKVRLARQAEKELRNFRRTQNPQTAHESFGAPKRENEFDDIVYATCLAIWYRNYHISHEAFYQDVYGRFDWDDVVI